MGAGQRGLAGNLKQQQRINNFGAAAMVAEKAVAPRKLRTGAGGIVAGASHAGKEDLGHGGAVNKCAIQSRPRGHGIRVLQGGVAMVSHAVDLLGMGFREGWSGRTGRRRPTQFQQEAGLSCW